MQYDDRFARVYDALMADVDYALWADYLASFLPRGASVAECACGTGELTLRLKRMGYEVTGMDISAEMLRVASEKARAAGLKIPFVQQDMRVLSLHKRADAVICACDGVNYLASMDAVRRFFKSACKALKDGGTLLFDISSRHKLSRTLGCNSLGYDDGELAYVWKNCYDPKSRLIEMELSFFAREGERYERFTETHVQRAHSEKELISALHAVGFTEVRVFEAFTRDAPKTGSERLQFVANKGSAGLETNIQ
ncbi:MAG: class I SAM-dependent methyltransferase [Clostridiaceae bacterium]|nr:class I SAM-dependent methyltransferase [Eubacteriales bacterium]